MEEIQTTPQATPRPRRRARRSIVAVIVAVLAFAGLGSSMAGAAPVARDHDGWPCVLNYASNSSIFGYKWTDWQFHDCTQIKVQTLGSSGGPVQYGPWQGLYSQHAHGTYGSWINGADPGGNAFVTSNWVGLRAEFGVAGARKCFTFVAGIGSSTVNGTCP